MTIQALQYAAVAMPVLVAVLFVGAYCFERTVGGGKALVKVRDRSHRGRGGHGVRRPS